MNDKKFNEKLRELICEIENLPQKDRYQLELLAAETKRRHEDIKENVGRITKSLGDLRICLKYLVFDLEATRRERDSLKEILENQSPDNDESEDSRGL